MQLWRTIGALWMLLAWVLVSGPSAYAETDATVYGSYPSEIGRREKSAPPHEEALAARVGTPYIARLTRERTSGNGEVTPPIALLVPSLFTTQGLESGLVRLHSFRFFTVPRKTEDGSTGPRAPPFLH